MAGIVAARDNSIGMRGVAPQATIYGYNFLLEDTDINAANAMTRNMSDTAVSNNSWGPGDNPLLNRAPELWERAVDSGVADGFASKGVFYVFAAGNGADEGDYGTLDEYANYYAVTAACAVDDLGKRTSYSESGANLWVCAPSSDFSRGRIGIATTNNFGRYTTSFGGTSAAAPQVSGVAALVRATDTSLSWRDVKLILAASARKNDPDNAGWETGALRYGADPNDPDRYQFNHEYGFGVVDAKAAVDLAGSWSKLPDRSTPDAPALNHVDPGTNFLTVAWTPPDPDFRGTSAITGYDVRYIRSDARNSRRSRRSRSQRGSWMWSRGACMHPISMRCSRRVSPRGVRLIRCGSVPTGR